MRLPNLLALPLLASVALAQDQWVESSANLALTLSSSGEVTTKPGKNDTVVHENSLQRFRLGNRDVLEALRAGGLIDQVEGWRVVGIWAYWPEPADPYVGNAYRFYARRGKGANLETVAIPSALLSIAPLQAAVGYRHVRAADETIRSGTETFSVYQQVTFDLAGNAGDVKGVETGNGRYVPVAGGTAPGRYLPNASKMTLQGEYTETEGDGFPGVVSGSLSFGAARVVTEEYVAPTGTSAGAVLTAATINLATVTLNTGNPTLAVTGGTLALGGDATGSIGYPAEGGLIKTGTGSLLTGSNTYFDPTTVSQGTLVLNDGSLSADVSTDALTVPGPLTFNGTLVLSSAGTYTLPASGTYGGLFSLVDSASFTGDFSVIKLQDPGMVWPGTLSSSSSFSFENDSGFLTGSPTPAP